MGKTPKPLSFLIHPSLVQTDEDRQILADLLAQGHTIHYTEPSFFSCDIALGPTCWRAFDLRYLDLAIKSARSVKYGKTQKSVAGKAKPSRRKST